MNQRPFSPSPRHGSGLVNARRRQLSKIQNRQALNNSDQAELDNLEFEMHLRSIARAPMQEGSSL